MRIDFDESGDDEKMDLSEVLGLISKAEVVAAKMINSDPRERVGFVAAFMDGCAEHGLSEEDVVKVAMDPWVSRFRSISKDNYKSDTYKLDCLGFSRMLEFLQICGALDELLENSQGWFRRENSAFGGKPAIQVIRDSSDGLGRVKTYLMSQMNSDFY